MYRPTMESKQEIKLVEDELTNILVCVVSLWREERGAQKIRTVISTKTVITRCIQLLVKIIPDIWQIPFNSFYSTEGYFWHFSLVMCES